MEANRSAPRHSTFFWSHQANFNIDERTTWTIWKYQVFSLNFDLYWRGLEHSKVITFIHLKIDFLLYYISSMEVLLSFFVTCVVCVFGINQVLLELWKANSQFLVPWRVNTGTMINFCIEIICWKMQSNRSASYSKTPPDCYPVKEKNIR